MPVAAFYILYISSASKHRIVTSNRLSKVSVFVVMFLDLTYVIFAFGVMTAQTNLADEKDKRARKLPKTRQVSATNFLKRH